MKLRPSHINESHWNEWVNDSAVDPDLTSLNVVSLSGYEPLDYLLYGLRNRERRNDGRLRNKWLKRYAHTESGGWWCSGVDVLTGEDTEWGQFKPDISYKYEEKFKGFDPTSNAKIKVIKYEAPRQVPTEITALKANFWLTWNIVRNGNEKAKIAWIQRFWQSAKQEISTNEVQRVGGMGRNSQLFQSTNRQATQVDQRENTEQPCQTIGITELQKACERREYGEIDRILQQAVWHRYQHGSTQSRDFNSGGIERLILRVDVDFWQWLIANPQIPLIITEGAKKAGAIITANYVAISLPGISNGYRQPKNDWGHKIGKPYLIPQLKAFAQRGREIIFCFDSDTKPSTVKNVRTAIKKTGGLFEREGCSVSVISWNYPEKGVDDLIASRGQDCFHALYKARIPLSKFKLTTLLDLSQYNPLFVNERYLSENLTPPANAQIIGIKSAKGTGKTQWLSGIIEAAINRGQRVIILCHREQLAIALAQRFGIDYRTEVRTSITKGALGYTLCIDSLHPHANPPFDPDEWQNALVIIDEAEQVFWHLLNSSTCSRNRVAIIDSFKQLLLTAVGTGGKVYLADADLSPIAIDYVRSLIGFPVKTWVVENQFLPNKGKRSLITYSGNDPCELLANLCERISRGEKPLVHTTGQKAKSKYGSINLEAYLKKRFPESKILRIDSESVAEPGHPAYGCMGNLNAILPNYDIAIASPVIETGVSIDIKGHFDSVWCIAYGVQTVDAVCQTVERLRDDVPRHLWARSTAKNNRIGNGSTNVKSLLASEHKLTRANISLLQQASVDEFEDLDVNACPESLNTWAKRACVVNNGKNNHRDEIVGKLKNEGYEVIESHSSTEEAGKTINESMKQTRQENYRVHCLEVSNAERSTDSELEELKNKRAKTKTERLAERKGNLSKLYGVEVTPELVEKDDNGWYSQLQLHYYLTIGNQFLAQRDKRSLFQMKEHKLGKAFKPDINKRQLSAPIKALELIDIKQFLDHEREFTASSLSDWLEKIVLFRRDIKTLLGVSINPEKDSAISVAQRILKKLGLKLEFKYWRGDRSSKQRVYSGCNINPDKRSLVFDNWLVRDESYVSNYTVHSFL